MSGGWASSPSSGYRDVGQPMLAARAGRRRDRPRPGRPDRAGPVGGGPVGVERRRPARRGRTTPGPHRAGGRPGGPAGVGRRPDRPRPRAVRAAAGPPRRARSTSARSPPTRCWRSRTTWSGGSRSAAPNPATTFAAADGRRRGGAGRRWRWMRVRRRRSPRWPATGRWSCVEGAAGAGKTTLLAAARDAPRRSQGRRLVVVTPTLKAAQAASAELGASASSAAKLAYAHGWRWDANGVWTRLLSATWTPRPAVSTPARARRSGSARGDLLLCR